MWNEWIKIYDDNESENDRKSSDILKNIQKEYYLMTILDNDFVNSKVEQILHDFLNSI